MTKITRYAPHAADAETRARASVGDPYQTGWCLRFVAHDLYGVDPLVDRPKFDALGYNTATDYWEAAEARGEVVKASTAKDLPAGSAVFWTGPEGTDGHAAFYLSGEKIISTDLPEFGRVGEAHLVDVAAAWPGYELVGAVLVDGNGVSLKPRDGAPPPRRYKVTAAEGARGTEGLSRSSATVKVAKHGATLTAARLVQVPGTLDLRVVVESKGREVYYDLADLERV